MTKFKQIDPSDLSSGEKLGPELHGTVHFPVGDQTEFEGAYITTNERLFMNMDMGAQVYERVVGYNEINNAEVTDEGVTMHFHIGSIPMVSISKGDAEKFVQYINEQVEKVKVRQEEAPE